MNTTVFSQIRSQFAAFYRANMREPKFALMHPTMAERLQVQYYEIYKIHLWHKQHNTKLFLFNMQVIRSLDVDEDEITLC